MPHQECTVCQHSDLEAINRALLGGSSVREVARRFGLGRGSVDRHSRKHLRQKQTVNTAQIEKIDAEIKKLTAAQTRAKKRRDTAGALAIARELRNWFVLRTKAEAMVSAKQITQTDATMSPTEALAVAKLLIEAQLTNGSSEVISWLLALAERVNSSRKIGDKTGTVADAPTQVDESEEVADGE